MLTTFAAFGGSTLANVLSGRPAPLFGNSSNLMISYITLAWYLVHQNRALRAFLSLRPIMAILAFGATAAKMRAIFAFMDDYVRTFPDMMLGAIVLGGLSGSGGQLFVSVENIVQRGIHVKSELSAPGWGFKSAYAAAAAYYVAVDPNAVLLRAGWTGDSVERDTARLYIAALLCGHAFVETLWGRHINVLFLVERVALAATGLRNGVKADEDGDERRGRGERAGARDDEGWTVEGEGAADSATTSLSTARRHSVRASELRRRR